MPSLTLNQTITNDSETYGGATTAIAGALTSISEDIPAESSNLAVSVKIKATTLKMLFLKSDFDGTATQQGPDNELQLIAHQPIVWHYLSQLVSPLDGVDVTAISVDNPGGADGILQIEILSDPTP